MADKLEAEEKQEALQQELIKRMDLSSFTAHLLDVEGATTNFDTNLKTGLSSKEAAARLEEYGPNELSHEEEKSLWERIIEQFDDILVQILLASATVSFLIALAGDEEEGMTAYVEPFVILLILILNAGVAVWQDANADCALEALKKMQAQESLVLRDSSWKIVDAKELVPGDIVQVKQGECIPADMRCAEIKSIALLVEQASLTGESVSVQKNVLALSDSAEMLQDQKNMLFSSTIVSSGTAVGIVAYTGMNTAIGNVHSEVMAAGKEESKTPLEEKVDNFGELLAKVIFVICVFVWIMNFNKFFDAIHGTPYKGCIYYFKIAVALAVAAIPEGLPAVITTCLALGTRKMSANNCIVRRLPSVETLGCTSVICSDKTGTLTKNEMCAVKFGVVGRKANQLEEFNVEENSYSPIGSVHGLDSAMIYDTPSIKHLAAVCAINNRATIEYDTEEEKFSIRGEPTEAALKVLAEKIGRSDESAHLASPEENPVAYSELLIRGVNRVATLDFSSERKAMSTVVTGYGGKKGNKVLLKGAYEKVLESCTKVITMSGEDVKLTESAKASLAEQIRAKAGDGFRCLGIAIALDGGNMKNVTKANASSKLADSSQYRQFEGGCSFLGYVCIRDPVRPEVKGAIAECKTAGVNVIMITGDAKETAVAIAKELDIIPENADTSKTCFTGSEFEALSAERKVEVLSGHAGKVFSRVEPRHKRELVKLLIGMGEIAAMTGDGVNDAPALKQAHIGIAMGITGTEVAKIASDMVLADDNFATIVKAVEEGRAIYSNMKAFIRYLISSNIGEVASIFFTAMLGLPEGFNSVQLLWVNLVTDGPPATALSFNPPDVDIMTKPPRKRDDNLISNWVFFRYMVVGIYVGLATVGIFVWWYTMAETGDGHTLLTYSQLSSWSDCPNWEGFTVNNFIDGMDLQSDPCKYFTDGKVKASTLSLSVLVVIEMLNALNAISEDNSLLTMSPFVNWWLIAAIASSILLHVMIVEVPFFNDIFSIYVLNSQEWTAVFAFSLPVIIIEEVLKYFGRIKNAADLKKRLEEERLEDERLAKKTN